MSMQIFQWSPDYVIAAPYFESAAECYKIAGELKLSRLMFLQVFFVSWRWMLSSSHAEIPFIPLSISCRPPILTKRWGPVLRRPSPLSRPPKSPRCLQMIYRAVNKWITNPVTNTIFFFALEADGEWLWSSRRPVQASSAALDDPRRCQESCRLVR